MLKKHIICIKLYTFVLKNLEGLYFMTEHRQFNYDFDSYGDPKAVRELMTHIFSIDDLIILLFDLGICAEEFSDKKSLLIVELLRYLERKGKIGELIQWLTDEADTYGLEGDWQIPFYSDEAQSSEDVDGLSFEWILSEEAGKCDAGDRFRQFMLGIFGKSIQIEDVEYALILCDEACKVTTSACINAPLNFQSVP